MGRLALAVLTLWFLAVLANVFIAWNAVTEMMYFELDGPSRESLAAARPWVWGSMIGFLVLAVLGLWMGSSWWPPLLVASTGIAGLIQVRLEDNGPIIALLFLPITIIGAIATVVIARPFPRQVDPAPRP
ncbi:hypothetical protein [Agromyces bauzanensis]